MENGFMLPTKWNKEAKWNKEKLFMHKGCIQLRQILFGKSLVFLYISFFSFSGLAQEEASKSPWTYSLFLLSSADIPVIDHGPASVGGSGYISFNYKLNSNRRLSIRPQWLYNTAGFNKYGDNLGTEFKMGDVYLQYSLYDLWKYGEWGLSQNLRLYLPTSDFSKKTKMIARFRSEIFFGYESRDYFYVQYVQKLDYYMQTQKAFLDPDTVTFDDGAYKIDPRQGNKELSLDHYLETEYTFNSMWRIGAQTGFEEEWRYGSAVEGIDSSHITFLKAAVGPKFYIGRTADFYLFIQNRAPLGNGYSFGRPKDNSLVLFTNVRF